MLARVFGLVPSARPMLRQTVSAAESDSWTTPLGQQDQPLWTRQQSNAALQQCQEIQESYPHQNAPLEQLLELGQAYQAHALCVFGCLLLCLCAVTPAQPGSNNM